jgi:hypothetical protein
MLNNFIYAKLKSLFEEKLATNEVPQEAIVFIEDTKEIWNHGTYFATPSGSSISAEEIENIVASSETIQAVMEQIAEEVVADSGKQDQILDLDEIRQGASLGSTAIQPGTGDGTKYLSDDGNYKEIIIPTTPSGISVIEFSESSIELQPNKFYKLTTPLTSLNITLAAPTDLSIVNEYMIEFFCQDTTISLPNNLLWHNDEYPVFENGRTYHISIINNFATVLSFTTPN